MNQSPRSIVTENIDDIATSKYNSLTSKQEMVSTSNNDQAAANSIEYPRNLVFEIAALVGELSTLFLTRVALDPPFEKLPSATVDSDDGTKTTTKEEAYVLSKPTTTITDKDVSKTMGKLLLQLLTLTHALDLSLSSIVRNKMALNAKKYPASLCKGKSGKYTQYSSVTGITKTEGQSTLDAADTASITASSETKETVEGFLAVLDQLTADIGSFATERLWSRYHKPRNLLLALLGELGELAELFQWRGDHDTIDSITKEEMDKIGQELADVTIYLIRLSDVSYIHLKAQVESVLAVGEES